MEVMPTAERKNSNEKNSSAPACMETIFIDVKVSFRLFKFTLLCLKKDKSYCKYFSFMFLVTTVLLSVFCI